MDAEIKREFDRLHRELKALKDTGKRSTWVGPGWVTEITGWSRERLRQARDQKIVECKRSEGGGWTYKLESIPEIFIKHPLKTNV